MKIMKLIKTQYFDEDGYPCDSYYEAKENSYHKDEACFVRKQKVMIFDNEEISTDDIFTDGEYEYYVFSMSGKPLFGTNNLNDFEDIK